MNKNRSSGVSWVKPAEPSFLTKFKSDVGFKEGPNVDTKRQVMPDLDDDGGSDREDELPQVVVLKSGDLTAEEVKTIKDGKDDQVDAAGSEAPSKGKILFKKPAKRSSSDKFQGITATSSKKKKSEAGKGGEEGKTGSKVKNNSLLSFGGDEDEED
ncbi:uncharacterized protein KIAA1143 homolog [Nothobranchius furzeri]|uniref:KIAA1143 n=3 Tax=Nothobranchius TaxID=28779 RepID=A0A1A8TZB4_NOTFU|nr:uncharacterized protein KIAA1143 homolog [Nothobranchius furzeri]KAF7225473.1 KIAA1143-like protein [Nothobranchius furzeri]